MSSENFDPCSACYEDIIDGEEFMTCADCCQRFHIGKCAGVGERSFKAKNAELRKALKCLTCRSSASRSQDSSSDASSAVLCKRLAEISKSLVNLTAKVDDLTSLKETVSSIEKSVQHMSDTYDKLLEVSNRHDKEIELLRKRVDDIEANQDGQQIRKLRQELNDLSQYSRRQNMEIHGMPVTDGEDLLSKVNSLAVKLDLPTLVANDIEGLHRLPSQPDKVPVVLIRFANRSTKTDWISKRKECEDDIRFFDNLTASSRNLLWLAKMKAKEMKYAFVWSKEGKIYARKQPGARAIRIACEEDIDKMV